MFGPCSSNRYLLFSHYHNVLVISLDAKRCMPVAEFETGDLWDSVANWVYSGLARGVAEVSEYFVPNRGENKLVSTLLFICAATVWTPRGEADTFLRRSSRSNSSRERRERGIERHTSTHAHPNTMFVYSCWKLRNLNSVLREQTFASRNNLWRFWRDGRDKVFLFRSSSIIITGMSIVYRSIKLTCHSHSKSKP